MFDEYDIDRRNTWKRVSAMSSRRHIMKPFIDQIDAEWLLRDAEMKTLNKNRWIAYCEKRILRYNGLKND